MPESVPAGNTLRPYHITWRAAARRPLFREDRDRFVYLGLLRAAAAQAEVRFLGYTLMADHVHVIALAESRSALAAALRRAHAGYARYFQATRGGFARRPRCYGCALDPAEVEKALAYIESNPVREHLVGTAESYRWSSAAAHLGLARALPAAGKVGGGAAAGRGGVAAGAARVGTGLRVLEGPAAGDTSQGGFRRSARRPAGRRRRELHERLRRPRWSSRRLRAGGL